MNNKALKAQELIQKMIIHCESHEYQISRKVKLTRSETRVMKFFNQDNTLTAINLANALALTKSRITFLINSLTEKGLIKREPDIRDRRFQIISATKKGMRVLDKINQFQLQLCADEFSMFTEEELDEFIRLLIKFTSK